MTTPGQQFRTARVQTLKSVADASGWNLTISDVDQVMEGGVHFYVYDHSTDNIWACSMSKTNFHKVRQGMHDVSLQQAVGNVARLVTSCMANPETASPDWEHELGMTLTVYITKTQTYNHTQHASLASHFVCIHYGKSGLIRPFAIAGSDRFLLPAASVVDAIERVIALDRKSHPDWLG